MTFPNFPDLKQTSRDALDRCGNQKTLALIYAGGPEHPGMFVSGRENWERS